MFKSLLVGLFIFLSITVSVAQDESQEFIRDKVELLRQYNELKIGDAWIAFPSVLAEFYENRDFQPAWSEENAEHLIEAIDNIELDGLDPTDYHSVLLNKVEAEVDSGSIKDYRMFAARDMLLTDALLRLAYHLLFGKVDPAELDPHWNMTEPIGELAPAQSVQMALDAGKLDEFIESLKPQNAIYTESRKTLQQYLDIAVNGSWPTIPDGTVLRPGAADERLDVLAKRLYITGDLADSTVETSTYNDHLVEAVKKFQKRHGLDDDGIVGKMTIAAMNVLVEDRINQIRVNLERGRWVLRNLPDRYILVNIAGYKLNYIENGEFKWRTRVQVGKTFRQTPVFKADVKYIVFNCTWTVPPTILRNDVIPAIKRDPLYLARKNMSVLDRSGNVLNASSIDWSQYSATNFPFIIRQGSGPTNALGLVKFIYPNKHFVFLHDTPSKALFQRADRSFSSGCIRVQDPFVLAEMLLEDKPGWTMDKINQALATKKQTTVYLENDMPVITLYWTAFDEFDGTAQFRKDIYDRDAAILKGLKESFTIKAAVQEKMSGTGTGTLVKK